MSPDAAAARDARRAGREALSLALIDARNHTLRWLAAFERADLASAQVPGAPAVPLRMAGRAGGWTEAWILRNVQAQRGSACDLVPTRLAPLDPACDRAFGLGAGDDADDPLPTPETTRSYLEETLEASLELLARAEESDEGLYFHRLALQMEDRTAHALATAALAAGLADAPWPTPWSVREREPLWLPARRFPLGSPPGGLVPANERWAHEEAVPEFEIDAQPVSWGRYMEFAEDGGYDDERWWSEAGWAWAARVQRRAPRDVEQLRDHVVVRQRGTARRVGTEQSVVHVTRHEAEAWCRWAGRRLPTEVEWELAACSAPGRGFAWGNVLEWTAGRARGWPGHRPLPGDLDPIPERGAVLRGTDWLAHARLAHPKARRFVARDADFHCSGFRSCAM